MKADILKIAGVKSEAEFYKKFPTEEDFMKVHGKAFAKAQRGAKIKKASGGVTQQQAMEYLKPVPENPLELEPWMTNDSNFPTAGFAQAKPDLNNILGQGLPIVGDLIEGIELLGQQKKELRRAKQMNKLTDVMLDASQSIADPIERKYVRPDDMIVQPDQLFPSYGTGSTMFKRGGRIIPMGEAGSMVPWGQIEGIGSNVLDRTVGVTGGSKIGGAVGAGIGSFFGPGGKELGKLGGQLIGGLVDRTDDKIKKFQNATSRNVDRMALGQSMQGLFSLNSGYMENGGNISNMEGAGELELERGTANPLSYNPHSGETIMFGGPSHEEGGMNIAFGGNPVEVEGGEPGMKMNDADGTENLVVYGNLKIPGYKKTAKNIVKDIAKNEDKIMKKVDRVSQEMDLLNVTDKFDKLKHKTLELNIKLADRKLQKYAQEKEDIAAMQEAINQTADEMGVVAEDLSRGKIKKARTGRKVTAATGTYVGPDDPPAQIIPLQVPMDKRFVNQIIPIERPYEEPITPHDWSDDIYIKYNQSYDPSTGTVNIPTPPPRPSGYGTGRTSTASQITENSSSSAATQNSPFREFMDPDNYPWITSPTAWDNTRPQARSSSTGQVARDEQTDTEKVMGRYARGSGDDTKEKIDWETALQALSSYIPYFRESDVERLDTRQILSELMDMGDREDPVQAQLFRPNLGESYNISLQDQANEIDAQARAAMRMAGNNPAAQAAIAAEAYRAKSQVLGEEFRQNQQLDYTTRQGNRDLLNQTQLQNLQILDKQYERQAMAKSRTKETLRNALSSISAKYLGNQLEGRTLGTYENLYNYRYDDNFRARNRNAPYTGWDMTGENSRYGAGNYPEGMVPQYEYDPVTGEQKVVRYRRETDEEKKKTSVIKSPSRNGSVVKALRSL